MLEINVVNSSEDRDEVEVGQIRYNDSLVVLIAHGEHSNLFDALAIKKIKETVFIEEFEWNSKGVVSKVIKEVYPNVAKGRLEVEL